MCQIFKTFGFDLIVILYKDFIEFYNKSMK